MIPTISEEQEALIIDTVAHMVHICKNVFKLDESERKALINIIFGALIEISFKRMGNEIKRMENDILHDKA